MTAPDIPRRATDIHVRGRWYWTRGGHLSDVAIFTLGVVLGLFLRGTVG